VEGGGGEGVGWTEGREEGGEGGEGGRGGGGGEGGKGRKCICSDVSSALS